MENILFVLWSSSYMPFYSIHICHFIYAILKLFAYLELLNFLELNINWREKFSPTICFAQQYYHFNETMHNWQRECVLIFKV